MTRLPTLKQNDFVAVHWLSDPGQVTQPLCASGVSMKREMVIKPTLWRDGVEVEVK